MGKLDWYIVDSVIAPVIRSKPYVLHPSDVLNLFAQVVLPQLDTRGRNESHEKPKNKF